MKFIAEIGLNYNGNIHLCYELIKQAKLAGADIAKFQLGWRSKKDEINNLDDSKISKLFDWGKYFDIEIMFSVLNEESLRMLEKYKAKSFKVASRTVVDNKELVKKILKKNKTTYISLGMWNSSKLPFKKSKNIKYLWCKSTYPNSLKDLKKLPKNFKNSNFAGFSDHAIGIETSLLAISREASIIEKHFTLDKSDTTIRDHALSATPDEFRLLVNLGRDINKRILYGV